MTQNTVPPRWQVVCVCVFLVLAVFAVFGQTAGFGFINYDDQEYVYQNPMVEKGLSVQAFGWAFTHSQVGNWIPLTTLSHMLDCQLFGLQPGGHHVVNVLWHAANAVLLFLVLRQTTGSLWRSAFVAAVFAVHPLRAESVAWISERKDVLSGFFFMLTIGAYDRYVKELRAQGSRTKTYYGAVMVFLALGLMAKSMVATVPFVLLLLDYWPLGRMHNRREFFALLREKIPLFVLSGGICVAAALAPGLLVAYRLPFADRAGNALVSYAVYLRQMVFPAALATAYPLLPQGEPARKVWLGLFLLTAISAAVIAFRKKCPWLLTGWLWYLGMLLPVIGIVQISGDCAHSDRYTYLPGIGIAIAVTWAVADGGAALKIPRMALAVLMAAVTGALIVAGHTQTSFWRDDETLWTRALACTQSNCVAHCNLAMPLVDKGAYEAAISECRQALQIKPHSSAALNNLGNALAGEGRFDEAITQYRLALQARPDYAEAMSDLGSAYLRTGDLDRAIAQYRKALELMPDKAKAFCNLGMALDRKGDLDGAIAQYRQAVTCKPDFGDARHFLGKALLRKGDLAGAMACLEDLSGSVADPAVKWVNLGNDCLQKGDLEESIICYRQTLRLDPRSATACANMGLAFLEKRAIKEAIESWEQALAIKPEQPNVQINLAWLLATTPDDSLRNGARAVALAEQVDTSSGGTAGVLHTLAAAYAAAGRYGEATATARRALELAVAHKNEDLTAKLPNEIKLYEADKPMRDMAQ
jgi:protein O-mannosyl-transferase